MERTAELVFTASLRLGRFLPLPVVVLLTFLRAALAGEWDLDDD